MDDPGSEPSAPGSLPMSSGEPPLRASFAHRLLLSVVPAAVLVVIAASAIWGDSGLLVRHDLAARLHDANEQFADLDRENQRIVHELVSMEQDPVVLERVVAEELGWARDGAVVYRFEEPR